MLFSLEERGKVHDTKQFAGLRLVAAIHAWAAANSDRDLSKAAVALAEAHSVYQAVSSGFQHITENCDAWELRETFLKDERDRLEEKRQTGWYEAIARAKLSAVPEREMMSVIANLLVELMPFIAPCEPKSSTVDSQWWAEIKRQREGAKQLGNDQSPLG